MRQQTTEKTHKPNKFVSRVHRSIAGFREFNLFVWSNPYLPKAGTYRRLVSAHKKAFEDAPTVKRAYKIIKHLGALSNIEDDASNYAALKGIYLEVKKFCTDAMFKLQGQGTEHLLFLYIYRGIANYRLAGYEDKQGTTSMAKYLYGQTIDDCTISIGNSPNNGSYAYMFRAYAHEMLGDMEKKEGNADAAKNHWVQAEKDYGEAIKIHSERKLFTARSEVRLKLGDKIGRDNDLSTAAQLKAIKEMESSRSNHWDFPIIVAGV